MTKRPDTSPQASAALIRRITQEVVRHDVERSRAAALRTLMTAMPKAECSGEWSRGGGCTCKVGDDVIPRDSLGNYFRVYRRQSADPGILNWLSMQYPPWKVSPYLFEGEVS